MKINVWKYIRKFKWGSIVIKNFLLISFITILPIIFISFATYQYFDNYIKDEMTKTNTNSITKTKDTIDMIAIEADRVAVRISMEQNFDDFFSGKLYENNSYDMLSKRVEISKILNSMLLYGDYIEQITVYNSAFDSIITSNQEIGERWKVTDSNWYEFYTKMGEKKNITVKRSLEKFNYKKNCITTILKAPLYNDNSYGAVIVDINLNKIDTFLSENNSDKFTCILDSQDNILYTTNDEDGLYFENLSEINKMSTKDQISTYFGKETLYAKIISSYNNWKYISLTPIDNFNLTKSNSLKFIFIIVIICTLLSFVLTVFISVRVFAPVKNILEYVEGNDRLVRDNYTKNEISYILETLEREKMKNEEELNNRLMKYKKANMEALQYQINPHFLYNTLEAINWKIVRGMGRGNEASNMILSLSWLLRCSLENEENIVSIETELEYAVKYIELMQMRYKKFTVEWDIEDAIKKYKTVKLSIQPILENAIYHGIKQKNSQGNITVKAYEKDEIVVFEIIDDGIGISRSDAERINDLSNFDSSHIGLGNVNQRIKILFGDEYGARILPNPDFGATVVLTLPKLL
jgi:two-component system sensor histidine kinase YesM